MTGDSITTPRTTDFITHGLVLSLGYARALLTGIEADQFAHMPVPGLNHPAFCYGHLSLYPNRVFAFAGRHDQQIEIPFDDELFAMGAECVEQDGRYPDRDLIVNTFFEGYERLLEVLPTIDGDVLERELPIEGRLKEMFPYIGSAVSFMSGPHVMVHLGQVSMWRRAMGMGSCM